MPNGLRLWWSFPKRGLLCVRSGSGGRFDDDELAAAILGPGSFVMAGINWPVFTVGSGVDEIRIDSDANQRFANGHGATLAEGTVVFLRAALIAMAFNPQGLAGQPLDAAGNLLDFGHFAGPDD